MMPPPPALSVHAHIARQLAQFVVERHGGSMKGTDVGRFYVETPGAKEVISSTKLRTFCEAHPGLLIFELDCPAGSVRPGPLAGAAIRGSSTPAGVAVDLHFYARGHGGKVQAASLPDSFKEHPGWDAIVGDLATFCDGHSSLLRYSVSSTGAGEIEAVVAEEDPAAAKGRLSLDSFQKALFAALRRSGGRLCAGTGLEQLYKEDPAFEEVVGRLGGAQGLCQRLPGLAFDGPRGLIWLVHGAAGGVGGGGAGTAVRRSASDAGARRAAAGEGAGAGLQAARAEAIEQAARAWKERQDELGLVGKARVQLVQHFEVLRAERRPGSGIGFCAVMTWLRKNGFRAYGEWSDFVQQPSAAPPPAAAAAAACEAVGAGAGAGSEARQLGGVVSGVLAEAGIGGGSPAEWLARLASAHAAAESVWREREQALEKAERQLVAAARRESDRGSAREEALRAREAAVALREAALEAREAQPRPCNPEPEAERSAEEEGPEEVRLTGPPEGEEGWASYVEEGGLQRPWWHHSVTGRWFFSGDTAMSSSPGG